MNTMKDLSCPKCDRFHERNVKCGTSSRFRNVQWPRGRKANVPRQYGYISRPQWEKKRYEDEEERHMQFNPLNFFTKEEEQKPWFTVIPMGFTDITPEDVKVKLNPLCRILIIKVTSSERVVRGTPKVMERVLTLPKFIEMEKLQVKLTPRGDLVVFAPFKTSFKGKLPYFEHEEETMNSPFFQERGLPKGLNWKTIPIIGFFKTPLRKRSTGRFGRDVSPLFRDEETTTEEDTDTTTTDEETEFDTETETETETEGEEDVFPGTLGKKPFNLKRQVLSLKCLLEKTFYPNLVDVKIVPKGTRGVTSGMRGSKQLEMIVKIKFIDFRSKELKVRMDSTRNVLIVEGLKMHVTEIPHMLGQKFLHREIELPEWLKVEEMNYEILPNGVLLICLPLKMTSFGRSSFGGYYRMRGYPRDYYYSYVKKGLRGDSKMKKNFGNYNYEY